MPRQNPKNVNGRKKKKIKNMRNLSFILVFSIIVCAAKAQTIKGTTMDEFNYVTKGLKVQLESGLDMKKGYKIEDVALTFPAFSGPDYEMYTVITEGVKKFKVKALYRQSETAPCAFIIIYKGIADEVYMCIPNRYTDDEVWSKSVWNLLALASAIPNYGDDEQNKKEQDALFLDYQHLLTILCSNMMK